MLTVNGYSSYHNAYDVANLYGSGEIGIWKWPGYSVQEFTYRFENFFHPFVGTMIGQLNATDVAGMLDSSFLGGPSCQYAYTSNDYGLHNSITTTPATSVTIDNQQIDRAAAWRTICGL